MLNTAVLVNAPSLLTEDDAAKFLNVDCRTLQAWRVRGGGPVYRKLGRLVRYSMADLETWLNARARHHTSEAAA